MGAQGTMEFYYNGVDVLTVPLSKVLRGTVVRKANTDFYGHILGFARIGDERGLFVAWEDGTSRNVRSKGLQLTFIERK